MIKNIIAFLLIVFLVSGCVTATFTKTGTYQVESREVNCDFNVYTLAPKDIYHEIGLIELNVGFAESLPTKINTLKEKVHEQVCAQGGNGLLVWQASGPFYGKATVIYIENQP
ncbi:MAG: hypothetical protein AAGB12_14865 [Pseudomonadota bacterium]